MPVDTRAATRSRKLRWRRWHAGLVAALTLVGLLFSTWDRIAALFKPAPVNENAEIVLDRSAAMDGPFEGGTRWQAAVAAVDSVLASVSTRDNLALRQFGGPCDANNTQLALAFHQNNVAALRSAVQRLDRAGSATLTRGLVEAAGDFDDPQRFGANARKRIVVVAGAADQCGLDPVEALNARATAATGVKLDFHFIGLNLPPEQQRKLNDIAAATSGEAIFVDRRDALTAALQQILVTEPTVADANAIIGVLNTQVQRIQQVVNGINQQDYASAGTAVRQANDDFKASTSVFEDLEARQGRPELDKLRDLARQNRSRQQQMLATMTDAVAEATRHDLESFNRHVGEYNELVPKYNDAIQEISKIAGALGVAPQHGR